MCLTNTCCDLNWQKVKVLSILIYIDKLRGNMNKNQGEDVKQWLGEKVLLKEKGNLSINY